MKEDSPLIFINYATPDRDRVVIFSDWLEEKGFNVWMDFRRVKPGQDWDFEIIRALNKATFFIMFISENSVERRTYLQRELKLALDRFNEKLVDDIYIIPILLDDVPIPQEIKRFQCVSANEANCCERIADSLNYQLEKLGIERKEIKEKEHISWTSKIKKEFWDGLPGYEVELQLLNFQSDEYINVSEIGEYINGRLLRELFRHREDKFFQSPDSFNYGQDKYRRTNTYDASCGEPTVVGKVISIQYSIHYNEPQNSDR